MGILYGRAGRLSTENAGFRPGQTDDDGTIAYYNSIDEEVEINLEVLGGARARAAALPQGSFSV
jgi:hypothetical protein